MCEIATVPLSDVCSPDRKITYGIVQPGKLHDGGVPIVRVNNFRGHRLDLNERLHVSPEVEASYARSRPQPNDLLISLVGSIGQVAIAPPEIAGWNLARAVGLVPVMDEHHAHWLFYALQTREAQSFIQRHANTTVQATFNLKDLANVPIPYPSEPVRADVLSVLGALDDKIELNRHMNETLEAMAQAIFRDWFVDFGPTRRKMESATDPVTILGGLIPAPEKAAPIAAHFPATFGDDGLPDGWEERPFVSFLEIVGGGTPKTKISEFWGGEIPWFSVVDTPPKGGVFVHTTEKTITEKGLAESSARLVPAGTTIITARGTVGNVAMAAHDMTFNQSCYALRARSRVGDRFVYLATERMVQRLQAMAHGSVFSTITRATFESLTFPWVGEDLFETFEELLEPVFAKINANGEESATLAATRDLLLPKLMSGEVRLCNGNDVI